MNLSKDINLDALVENFISSPQRETLIRILYSKTGKRCCTLDLETEEILICPPAQARPAFTGDWFNDHRKNAVKPDPTDQSLYFIESCKKGTDSGILFVYLDSLQRECLALLDVSDEDMKGNISVYSKLLLLAKLLYKQNMTQRRSRYIEANIFCQLLLEQNNMTRENIMYQAKKLEIELPPERCYVVEAKCSAEAGGNTGRLSVEENLQRFSGHIDFMKQSYHILCGVTENRNLFYIVPIEYRKEEEHIRSANIVIGRIRKYLSKYLINHTYAFGVGLPVDSIEKCYISYNQAHKTLKHSNTLFGENMVLHYRNMGVFRLLEMPGLKNQLKPFLMDYLDPILCLSREEAWPLLETAYAYILCGFNNRECARKIYVHHNTVRYRLEKFSRQCNLDFRVPWELVTILVCFEILKFCPEYGPSLSELEAHCKDFDLHSEDAKDV